MKARQSTRGKGKGIHPIQTLIQYQDHNPVSHNFYLTSGRGGVLRRAVRDTATLRPLIPPRADGRTEPDSPS